MKVWAKGAILILIFLFGIYFVEADYPEYEITEVKFIHHMGEDRINLYCHYIEVDLCNAVLISKNNCFCEIKSTDTMKIWTEGFNLNSVSDYYPTMEFPPIDSVKEYKQKRLRIIVNGKRIY